MDGAAMSLINKMLQDLDQRNASPSAGYGRSAAIAQQLRPVKRPLLTEWFWYAMAVVMLLAVAWIIWLAWQLNPRPIVTDLAYQTAPKADAQAAAPKAAAPAPANPKSSVDAQTAAHLAQPAAEQPAAAQPQDKPAAPPAEASRVDMLKLTTELGTSVRERSRAVAEPRKPARNAAVSRTPGTSRIQTALAPAPGQIDRRASGTARDRAAAEFRRAVTLVNQGRVAEGLDGLRGALKTDPGYDEVRQTLVALLIEAKRMDEAAAVLQDGLGRDPSNTGFAVLLARVMVERNDVNGALGLLQKHAAAGEANPEYHAFAAALYQRLERHGDAVAEYQAALKLAPNAGVWWIGLGISQQALNRPKDAVDAFQRAKASGNIGPELAAFTDRRLKLLQ
jgi:MSHA biogenesis protein MshN